MTVTTPNADGSVRSRAAPAWPSGPARAGRWGRRLPVTLLYRRRTVPPGWSRRRRNPVAMWWTCRVCRALPGPPCLPCPAGIPCAADRAGCL